MGYPTKNSHFGFLEYHHLRKHPFDIISPGFKMLLSDSFAGKHVEDAWAKLTQGKRKKKKKKKTLGGRILCKCLQQFGNISSSLLGILSVVSQNMNPTWHDSCPVIKFCCRNACPSAPRKDNDTEEEESELNQCRLWNHQQHIQVRICVWYHLYGSNQIIPENGRLYD